MPDDEGRIRGITVPAVPWLERCEDTKVAKPECSCRKCHTEQIEKHGTEATKRRAKKKR
jgi:hypothetical protein